MRQRRGEARGRRRDPGDRGGPGRREEQSASAQRTWPGAPLREQTREKHGGQEEARPGARAQNGEDARHHHGHFHSLLAALLH